MVGFPIGVQAVRSRDIMVFNPRPMVRLYQLFGDYQDRLEKQIDSRSIKGSDGEEAQLDVDGEKGITNYCSCDLKSSAEKKMGFRKDFKRRDFGHYGDFPLPHRLSLSVVQISPRSPKASSCSIPPSSPDATQQRQFSYIPKRLNCSVDEPSALQAPDSERMDQKKSTRKASKLRQYQAMSEKDGSSRSVILDILAIILCSPFVFIGCLEITKISWTHKLFDPRHPLPAQSTKALGPFSFNPKHLNRCCSVDEPPAVQAPDSKEWICKREPVKKSTSGWNMEIWNWFFVDRKQIDSRSSKGLGDEDGAHLDVYGEKRIDN
ncbi:unnamed protein product [Caenorhabditis nigoni]